ncbi:neutrophil collagenase [Ranunculus cassubicifolius]
MALKAFSCISIILFLLPILSIQALPSIGTNLSPFEFLQHLKGCRKGETMKGLSNLKQYLKKFGYLDQANSDEFDDFLESAIKTYQLNYNLNSTGILDAATLRKMSMPRCGVPDVVNGTTTMRSGKKRQNHTGSSTFHTVSHYSFFPNLPKWPNSKTHLTWAVDITSANKAVLSPILTRAFTRWSSVTQFTFEEITDYTVSDLTIGVHTGDHGDGSPFDGPSGTLAHAFAPVNGRLHFDGDETWADGIVVGAFDLQTVSLHEIGHLLGLSHSSVEGAIMYPSIPSGYRGDLQGDDVQGIKALYNL